jgi:hypothetical protein
MRARLVLDLAVGKKSNSSFTVTFGSNWVIAPETGIVLEDGITNCGLGCTSVSIFGFFNWFQLIVGLVTYTIIQSSSSEVAITLFSQLMMRSNKNRPCLHNSTQLRAKEGKKFQLGYNLSPAILNLAFKILTQS